MAATSPSHRPDPEPARRGLHSEPGPAARLAPRVPGGARPGARGSADTRAPPSLGLAPAATAESRGDPGARHAVGSAGGEGGAGAARGGATPSPQAVPPATYPRRRRRRWWPRSGSRARWLGIMGMARPSSGGGARPGRTPARESAPTCTASACARTRTARGRSARASAEAAAEPSGVRACAGTLLSSHPGLAQRPAPRARTAQGCWRSRALASWPRRGAWP